jgi:homeobox-leucine zipper protein
MMVGDGVEDVIITANSTKKLRSCANAPDNNFSVPGGIICAKASMLLQVASYFLLSFFCILWVLNKK